MTWGQVTHASGVKYSRKVTSLQINKSKNTDKASILVDEEEEINSEEKEEGSGESNDEEYNDCWSDDEVGDD